MQCYASGEVRCSVVISVVISFCLIELSVPVVQFLLFHFFVLILLVVILFQFIPLFSRSHFSHMFSLYSHGILGVVFTNPFSCVSHLGKLAMYTSLSSCLKIWKSFWSLSFLASLAICMIEIPVSSGVSNCSFNSLRPTFTSSLSSRYFGIFLAASS